MQENTYFSDMFKTTIQRAVNNAQRVVVYHMLNCLPTQMKAPFVRGGYANWNALKTAILKRKRCDVKQPSFLRMKGLLKCTQSMKEMRTSTIIGAMKELFIKFYICLNHRK